MGGSGPLLVILGLGLGTAGWRMLRGVGRGWRIGRLLAAAPQHSVAEARALAADDPAYVRVHGRIDSDEEFPDDDGQPLVYRRRRLQRRVGRSGWQTLDDDRLAVGFGLAQRGERIVIDVDALGDGLVVVPRVSTGVASELPPDRDARPFPPMSRDTPVRVLIERLSAIDHATAAGVPELDAHGQLVLRPGLGRPLILTDLELDEAMRVLASAGREKLLLAAGLLSGAALLVAAGVSATLLRR